MSSPAGEATLQAPDTERALLGALLVAPEEMSLAADLIKPETFTGPLHRRVFRALLRLYERSDAVEPAVVADELRSENGDPSAGERVVALLEQAGSPDHIEQYCEVLRDRALVRTLVRTGQSISEEARGASLGEGRKVLDEAEQGVLRIANALERGKVYQTTASVVPRYLNAVDEARKSPDDLTGLPTGFPELDELLGGLEAGHLIVVAGRPSMGKTAWALNVLSHVALEEEEPVALFSLEMPAVDVAGRLICADADISFTDARRGRLEERDRETLRRSADRIQNAPITIAETASLTPLELRSRARRIRDREGLSLLVLDYTQLMSVPPGAQNREQEVAQISRSLKELAMELDIPVLAISQLSRGPERRASKRPQLSDLRESGAIEQDADVVLFPFREEVYVDPTDSYFAEVKDKGELIVAKHRNGQLGSVGVRFEKECIRFRPSG